MSDINENNIGAENLSTQNVQPQQIYQQNVQPQPQDIPPKERIKAARRVFSRLGFRILFGTLALFGVCFGAQFLVLFNWPELYDDVNTSLLVSLLPQYLIGMPALAAIMWNLPKKAPEKKKVTPGWFLIFFMIAYALMIVSSYAATVVNILLSALAGKGVSTYAVQEYVLNGNIWLIFVFTVICAPILEELIFRKLLIDRCGPYGEAAGALLSGWVFGLYHGNITQAIYAFALGYFLALIYQKTGKIKITIGIHMMVNFLGSVVAVKVLELVNLSDLSNLQTIEDIEAYAQGNMTGLIVYMLYAFMIGSLVIAGIVLLIVHRKKFLPAKGIVRLPRHSTFKAVIINWGVGVFSIIMFAYVAYNFLAS